MLRGWALFSGWFYSDDFRLLHDAQAGPLTWKRLLEPFDSQFMPSGRLIVWLVSQSESSWTLAASLTLAGVVLAGVACAWMLFTLFGPKPWALAPLALYLFSPLTMPAMMWWAAALNQVPLQVVTFVAVASWMRYARSRRLGWLALTLLTLAVGLTFYVKTALVFVLLAYLLVAYFSSGSLFGRIWRAIRRYWPALVTMTALAGGYAAFYSSQVPSIIKGSDEMDPVGLAEVMVGQSLITGFIGGPWHWGAINAPAVPAEPPAWGPYLGFIVVLGFGIGAAMLRERTGRAWLLLGCYTGLAFALVVTSRATIVGKAIGLELRYVTDVAPVAVLCMALATMTLVGADEPSVPRRAPLMKISPNPMALGATVCAVVLSGIWSTMAYAQVWHSDHPGASYSKNVIADLGKVDGEVDLVKETVPADVVIPWAGPFFTSDLVPLLADNAQFPSTSSTLHILAEDGRLHRAGVDGVMSPTGPIEGCGWLMRKRPVTVPLESTTLDYSWWLLINYASDRDGVITVTAGGTTQDVRVTQGPGAAYVAVSGAIDEVVIDNQSPQTSVCVDKVTVGKAVPFGEPVSAGVS